MDRTHRLLGAAVAGSSNPSVASSSFGGVARNVAELLARLGAPVALHASAGDDTAGRDIRAHLDGLGVDTAGLELMPGAPTAEYLAIIAHDTGELVIGSAAMAGTERRMDARIDAILAGLPVNAMIFAEANLTEATLTTIVDHARRTGRFLALDAVSVAKSARLPARLVGVGLIVMNRDEARAVLGSPDEAAVLAAALRDRGASTAVVTAGAEGAALADAEGVWLHPVPAVDVRDVTGAGDSLIAAMLWRISGGDSARQALPWGLAAAGATVGCRGSVHPALSADFLTGLRSRMPGP